MSVKLRMRRMGRKKIPVFSIVATDSRNARDGRYIEDLGRYYPLEQPAEVRIEEDRVIYWLNQGAQPSNTVRSLLRKRGILLRRTMELKGESEEAIEAAVAEHLERMAEKGDEIKKTAEMRRQEALEAERKRAKELEEEARRKAEEERKAKEEAARKAKEEAAAAAKEKKKAEAAEAKEEAEAAKADETAADGDAEDVDAPSDESSDEETSDEETSDEESYDEDSSDEETSDDSDDSDDDK